MDAPKADCRSTCDQLRLPLDELKAGEEERAFAAAVFFGIGAVHRIFGHVASVELSDRSGLRLGGVGCTYHLAIVLNCVVTLQDHHHDGPASHELAKFPVKRSLTVHRVESFRLSASQCNLLEASD